MTDIVKQEAEQQNVIRNVPKNEGVAALGAAPYI